MGEENTPAGLTKEAVIAQIREAFRGAVLGNGIGLSQGNAIDDYEDEATCLACREQDEKINWETIPVESLNKYWCSLSFFDAEGMRFHLPAFLIADLNEELKVAPVFHLTHLYNYAESQLVLLSPEQRAAVRNYLLFVKDLPNYEFDRAIIEQALGNYWNKAES